MRLRVLFNFRLSHCRRRFVFTVHIPKFAPSVLVSGGGDPMLKVWNWMSGELLRDIPVGDVVEPFIAVRPPKGQRPHGEGDGEGEVKLGKRKRRRGKGKAATEEDPVDEAADGEDTIANADPHATVEEDVTMKDVDERDTNTGESAATREKQDASEDPVVLVIHRIASVEMAGQGRFLVFNAVGYVIVHNPYSHIAYRLYVVPPLYSFVSYQKTRNR